MKETAHAIREPIIRREMRSVNSAEQWLDVGDLARRFKTSIRHVYRMADAGRMPWGVKLGQLRRWSLRDVEAWEADGCPAVRSCRRASR